MARTRGGGKRRRRGRQARATTPTPAPLNATPLPLADQVANLLSSDPASVVRDQIAPHWEPHGRVRQALRERARQQGKTVAEAKVEALMPTLWARDSDLMAQVDTFLATLRKNDNRPATIDALQATRREIRKSLRREKVVSKRVARVIADDPRTDTLVARPFIECAERDLLAEWPRSPILLLAGERHRAQHVPLPQETLPEMESDILPEETETATILPEQLCASADVLTRLVKIEDRERRFNTVSAVLPPRTRECLDLLKAGLSEEEIAATMEIEQTTVRVHCHQIRRATPDNPEVAHEFKRTKYRNLSLRGSTAWAEARYGPDFLRSWTWYEPSAFVGTFLKAHPERDSTGH